MIVVDASVLASVVGDDGSDGDTARARLAREPDLSAPDLADVETVSVLRRLWLNGNLSDSRFRRAVVELRALAIPRYPVGPFMLRAFDLRANVTPYDACYVALAEALACPLVTADARLARSPGLSCPVEVLG